MDAIYSRPWGRQKKTQRVTQRVGKNWKTCPPKWEILMKFQRIFVFFLLLFLFHEFWKDAWYFFTFIFQVFCMCVVVVVFLLLFQMFQFMFSHGYHIKQSDLTPFTHNNHNSDQSWPMIFQGMCQTNWPCSMQLILSCRVATTIWNAGIIPLLFAVKRRHQGRTPMFLHQFGTKQVTNSISKCQFQHQFQISIPKTAATINTNN